MRKPSIRLSVYNFLLVNLNHIQSHEIGLTSFCFPNHDGEQHSIIHNQYAYMSRLYWKETKHIHITNTPV